MAYKVKHTIISRKSEDYEETKSYLKAKFKFRRETPPKNRWDVCKRSYPQERSDPLVGYLDRKGFKLNFGMVYYRIFLKKEGGGYLKIIQPFYLFTNNFTIKMESHGNVPLEEMINLDELNTFILTGKKNERANI